MSDISTLVALWIYLQSLVTVGYLFFAGGLLFTRRKGGVNTSSARLCFGVSTRS
jgi:hypothetical protein